MELNTTTSGDSRVLPFDPFADIIPSSKEMQCVLDKNINYAQVILYVVNPVSLCVVAVVAASAFLQFRRSSTLNGWIKLLFYISVVSSFLSTLGSMATVILCAQSMIIPARFAIFFVTAGYLGLLLSLLATLLLRLYTSFQHSVYKISLFQRNVFVLLYLIVLSLSIMVLILYALKIHQPGTSDVLTFLICIAELVYIVTALWSVIVFSRKLIELTKSQSKSLSDVLSFSAKDLTKQQQKLIASVSKYFALFIIAVFTSLLSGVLIFVNVATNRALPYLAEWVLILVSVDCCINVICLYLQYSFSVKHYKRWCSLIDRCFRGIFVHYVSRSIESQRQHKQLRVRTDSTTVSDGEAMEHKSLNVLSDVEEEDGHETEEDSPVH